MRGGGGLREGEAIVGLGDEGVLARERPVVCGGFVAVGQAALAVVVDVGLGDGGEGGD